MKRSLANIFGMRVLKLEVNLTFSSSSTLNFLGKYDTLYHFPLI
jgi:hypothetical protein